MELSTIYTTISSIFADEDQDEATSHEDLLQSLEEARMSEMELLEAIQCETVEQNLIPESAEEAIERVKRAEEIRIKEEEEERQRLEEERVEERWRRREAEEQRMKEEKARAEEEMKR